MARIAIVSDSTCDLPKSVIEQEDIKIVPLYIGFNEEVLRDGVDITTLGLYEKVEEKGFLPKTSAASTQDFYDMFTSLLNDGYDEIVYLGIGSTLSSTLQNAFIAKNEIENDKIYLVDSLNLSTAIGFFLLKACKYRKQGLSGKEIAEEIEKLVPKVRAQFCIDTMEYLHKGGRCSGMTKLLGTVLKIKPIIKVVDGKMDVYGKPRGKKNGLREMVKDTLDNKDNIDMDCIFITDSYAGEEDQEIFKMLEGNIDTSNIMFSKAGCVISSHCGPKTIGILYIEK